MAWKIIGPTNDETTIEALVGEYPDLVAYDESGFDIDLNDLRAGEDAAGTALADAGYTGRQDRRILFWANEADSVMDDGSKAVAEARWEEADEESAA